MAKQEPTPVPIVDQITHGIEDLKARRAESRALAVQAAASTDAEESVDLDMRSRSLALFCDRQKTRLEDLIRKRNSEQLAEHVAKIDALYREKIAEAEALAKALDAACLEVNAAALKLFAIGVRSENSHGLSGADLLKWTPSRSGHPYESTIRQGLAFRMTSLGRAAQNLKNFASDPDKAFRIMGNNASDSLTFSELRAALGTELHFDEFDLAEDLEPVAVVAATH